jgi:hypothetical protein
MVLETSLILINCHGCYPEKISLTLAPVKASDYRKKNCKTVGLGTPWRK